MVAYRPVQRRSLIVILVLIEIIFFAVYAIARKTRQATLFAIERHDVVMRSLAQRDALLHEARHDLVQTWRVGGGGRFSGAGEGPFGRGRARRLREGWRGG